MAGAIRTERPEETIETADDIAALTEAVTGAAKRLKGLADDYRPPSANRLRTMAVRAFRSAIERAADLMADADLTAGQERQDRLAEARDDTRQIIGIASDVQFMLVTGGDLNGPQVQMIGEKIDHALGALDEDFSTALGNPAANGKDDRSVAALLMEVEDAARQQRIPEVPRSFPQRLHDISEQFYRRRYAEIQRDLADKVMTSNSRLDRALTDLLKAGGIEAGVHIEIAPDRFRRGARVGHGLDGTRAPESSVTEPTGP